MWGGHTIERHVGRSDTYLRRRLEKRRGSESLSAASTFANLRQAEQFIGETLRRNASSIWRWLHSRSRHPLAVSARFSEPTGRVMLPQTKVAEAAHGVRVLLLKDASAPQGFRIKTAFPER